MVTAGSTPNLNIIWGLICPSDAINQIRNTTHQRKCLLPVPISSKKVGDWDSKFTKKGPKCRPQVSDSPMTHFKRPLKPLKLQITCLWHKKKSTFMKNYGTHPIQLPLPLTCTRYSVFFLVDGIRLSHYTLHAKGTSFAHQFLQYAVVGAQTASTDNLFKIFGHGSRPKLLFDTVTMHLGFPLHFFSRMVYDAGAWQVPCS